MSCERDLLRRRARIGAGNYEAIRLLAPLINPLNGFIPAWIFFSHKLLRWAAPFLMIAVYISNLALLGESALYLILFTLQNMFYLLAAATPLLKKIIKKNATSLGGAPLFCHHEPGPPRRFFYISFKLPGCLLGENPLNKSSLRHTASIQSG